MDVRSKTSAAQKDLQLWGLAVVVWTRYNLGRSVLHQTKESQVLMSPPTQLISVAFSQMNGYEWIIFVCLCKPGLFRAEYACHGWWWEENGYSYLIATPLSRASTGARRYCFVFRETLEPQQDKLRGNGLRKSGKVRSSSLLGFPSGSSGGSRSSSDDSSSSSLVDVNPEYSEPEFKRILHFSSIADSCRRNVAPGIEGNLAFNVTSHGKRKFLQNMYTL